jgi:capsular polysaccharide transport system ATP-binding protein
VIQFQKVTKSYNTRFGVNHVLNNVNLEVKPSQRLGILGVNGSGKSTLVRLLSGASKPSKGKVTRAMSVSWPLGLTGGFQTKLTGLDNVRFICRVYGVHPDHGIAYIEEFTELGKFLKEPVHTYSSGMRSKLAFAISFLVDFDCYLIDEALAVGDARFREKCHYELFERRKEAALVLVSHSNQLIRQYCDSAVLLKDKTIHHFSSLDEAIQNYV